MAYHLIYDVAQAGFGTGFFLVTGWGLLMMAIGAALIRRTTIAGQIFAGNYWLDPGQQRIAGRIFAWVFFLVALTFTVGVSGTLAMRHLALADVSRRNACKTLEGVVADYAPVPEGGHGSEHFTILDVPFAYSETDFSEAGYNTTSGPIRDGLRVRLCFVPAQDRRNNVIVRLETAS